MPAASAEPAHDAGAGSAPASRRQPGAMEPRRILQDAVAAKALDAWLQNRHQTLFPLTLNLRILDPAARRLIVRMVAASVLAGGAAPASEERQRIQQDLAAAGAGEEERALLDAALDEPGPLPPLLGALQEARLGAHAYAASLIALDRRADTGRAWLHYLATRFRLPSEVILGLERRQRRRR